MEALVIRESLVGRTAAAICATLRAALNEQINGTDVPEIRRDASAVRDALYARVETINERYLDGAPERDG